MKKTIMKVGTIKTFRDRGFGYITINDSGKDIFYHFNDGRKIKAGKVAPEFCDEKLQNNPKAGDRVILVCGYGHKGPKADPWGFFSDYEKAKQEMTKSKSI